MRHSKSKSPKPLKSPKNNRPAAKAPMRAARNSPLADFALVTSDVCRGVHRVLKIIERRTNPTEDTDALRALAMASTWLLSEHAKKKIVALHEVA
ncbi:hypothetical protein ACVBEF_00210 [Glaciimonas sp. GG7]